MELKKYNTYIIFSLFAILFIGAMFMVPCDFICSIAVWWKVDWFREIIKCAGAIVVFGFTISKYISIKNKSINNFVKISVESNSEIIKTKVWNDVNEGKGIKFALLVITPFSIGRTDVQFTEDLNRISEKLIQQNKVEVTDDLIHWLNSAPFFQEDHYFIPLPFYYIENISIGNEDLTFEVDVDAVNKEEPRLKTGTYSVRFFVFSNGDHLHRSTHCILKIK